MILCDFNLPHDFSVDSWSGEMRDSGSRNYFDRWLASLGVDDAWRRHHLDKKFFSGPINHVTRLNYIFLDALLVDAYFYHY